MSLKRVKRKLDVNCWLSTAVGKVFLDFQFGRSQLFAKFVAWFFLPNSNITFANLPSRKPMLLFLQTSNLHKLEIFHNKNELNVKIEVELCKVCVFEPWIFFTVFNTFTDILIFLVKFFRWGCLVVLRLAFFSAFTAFNAKNCYSYIFSPHRPQYF